MINNTSLLLPKTRLTDHQPRFRCIYTFSRLYNAIAISWLRHNYNILFRKTQVILLDVNTHHYICLMHAMHFSPVWNGKKIVMQLSTDTCHFTDFFDGFHAFPLAYLSYTRFCLVRIKHLSAFMQNHENKWIFCTYYENNRHYSWHYTRKRVE